jgi:hypothetical protein
MMPPGIPTRRSGILPRFLGLAKTIVLASQGGRFFFPLLVWRPLAPGGRSYGWLFPASLQQAIQNTTFAKYQW